MYCRSRRQEGFKSLGKDAHENLYGLSLRLHPACEGARWDGGGAPEWESRERHRGSFETGAKIIFHVVVKFAHLHLPRRKIRFHRPGVAENPDLFCLWGSRAYWRSNRERRNPINRNTTTIGVGPETSVGEFQVCSGGRRLTSNGPFIRSHYHAGVP